MQATLLGLTTIPQDFGAAVGLAEIQVAFDDARADLTVTANWHAQQTPAWLAEHGNWHKSLQMGKSYMVGPKVSAAAFLKTHQSALVAWQKLAYRWARQNPGLALAIENGSRTWQISERGAYVNFALPYHDKGGERTWISNDGRTKVFVNID